MTTQNNNFADALTRAALEKKSFLCAGYDPVLTQFPKCILDTAAQSAPTNEEAVFLALTSFFDIALRAMADILPCVKPNLAFFEQYGLGGMRAYYRLLELCKEHRVLVIADAKRGDIGTTAQAYSNAFLGAAQAFGKPVAAAQADALTVNPFLGFDTLEPFLKDCAANGRGIFVLVKTSNPGSGDIQNLSAAEKTISQRVAETLSRLGASLCGDMGFSSIGAVVGATYPAEAKMLRALMPTNLFLIPGLGAQGGSAQDAVAGFTKINGITAGGIINASRGVFGVPVDITREELPLALRANAEKFRTEINQALADD